MVAMSLRRTGAPFEYETHHLLVGLGRFELVVRADQERLIWAAQKALRAGDIGVGDGRAHRFQREAVMRKLGWIGLNSHGWPDIALHSDPADARHLAEARAKDGVSKVAQPLHRQSRGGKRERQDRRIGRVHLRVSWRIGQVLRKLAARGADRGLHVLPGGVDIAVEGKLQRDLAQPLRTRRAHILERRDLAELALQRRGDEPRHGVGIGARKLRRHLDDGKVHLGQRRDRQIAIGEQAAQQNRHRQKRGRNRARDEGS